MSEIGIVIVTYNSAAEIGPCLDAALATGAEVVVVDNASEDGTIAQVARRGVRLIANSTNRGFAAAVNQGFVVLECDYVLLLNPDSILMSGLESLKEACDLPGAAGAGGCLKDAKGALQIGFMVRTLPNATTLILESLLLNRIFPHNAVNRRYRCLNLNYASRVEVEQPAGAFLMIRRAVWERLGGLDEGFVPLWFEDVDFCRRIADRGYKLYFVPEAHAKHAGGHSIARLSVETRRFYWYGSLLRYSAKHFRPIELKAVCVAVVLGSIPRVIADLISTRSLKSVAAFWRVVRLAGGFFLFGWRHGVARSNS